MSGSFNPPESDGEFTVLTGTAPVSEMRGYTKDVLGYTHGRGRLFCSLKGYEPCHNAEEVIASKGYDPDADTLNPCDSVFCSHGAGHTVKWNEVKSRMHLAGALDEPKREEAKSPDFKKLAASDDIFALDKELMRIFEQTYGPVRRRTAGETRRRIAAAPDPKKDKHRHSNAPKYEGEEYLLVDGYNVIFSWDNLRKLSENNIDGARAALINILCNYQGFCGSELIVVFDAYKVKGAHREIEKVNNISVVYTREAETADMYIEKVTHKLAKNHKVRVVTSDALEQIIILGNGALRVSSRSFYDEVRFAEEEIKEIISGNIS